MITSKMSLPDAVPNLSAERLSEIRERVIAADSILREEADKIKGHTVKAEWTQDGLFPLSERVQLRLQLGKVMFVNTVWTSTLASADRVRKQIRDDLWEVVTTYAMNNQEEILRLLEELKQEPASVGA